MDTDIESALDRIIESGIRKLGIPKLEAAPAQEVVALEVNAHVLDAGLLGDLVRQGVTELQLLEAEEGAVAHPPSAHCGVVVVGICAVAGPEGVDIAVVLTPVAVGIGLKQLGIVHERSRTGDIFRRIVVRGRIGCPKEP